MTYYLCLETSMGVRLRCRRTWFDKDEAIAEAKQLADAARDDTFEIIDEKGNLIWKQEGT